MSQFSILTYFMGNVSLVVCNARHGEVPGHPEAEGITARFAGGLTHHESPHWLMTQHLQSNLPVVLLLLSIGVVDAAARGVSDFLVNVAHHGSAGGGGG
ncbi:hypothetical protein E2C01_022885 [Portunus trituberculatus]|uniref:Uncharacterized protein n=1 Tax=Portunus trituberculatus TaxID=210409 RepID=A0A5B7E6L8_PORTR|nr:hypothetical protein [Portunus trituberculatus]